MNKKNNSTLTKSILSHIGLGAIFRVSGILLNFLVIRVSLSILGKESFGLWVTLLTIINWVSFFDLGIGSGLRNKVTSSLELGKRKLAKEYISTGYITLGSGVFLFSMVFLILSKFVSWKGVFNSTYGEKDLYLLLGIVVVGSLINFFISLVIQLYYSIQKASVGALGAFVSQGITLLALLLLRGSDIDILGVAFINLGAMILTNFIFNIIFFSRNKDLSPRVEDFSKKHIHSLTSLGGKFFIIQMAAVAILTTDNMIITRLLGPEYVTNYNLISKLFSLVIIGHSIIVNPLWSAFTSAYSKGDLRWLKRCRRIMYLLMIPIIVFIIILGYMAPYIIHVWIGKNLEIDRTLVGLFALYTVIYTWSNLHTQLLNGLGRTRVQLPIWIFQGLINIPLSIYFVRVLNIGIYGVILGTTLSLVLFSVIGPIDLQKGLKKMELEGNKKI